MPTKTVTTYKTFFGFIMANDGIAHVTTFTKAYSRTRTGLSNPKWRSQIAAVANASTALTASEERLEWQVPVSGYAIANSKPFPNQGWVTDVTKFSGLYNSPSYGRPLGVDDTLPTVPAYSGSTAEVNNRAITQLYRRLNSYHHQLQGGVVLGEIRKTLELIARPALALRRGVNQFRSSFNKRIRGAKKTSVPKILADTYLEYTFGWQPLLYDCKDACIALARMEMGLTPSRFRVFASDSSVSLQEHFANIPVGNARIQQDTEEGQTYTVIYYGAYQDSAQWKGSSNSLDQSIALCGFDLASFAPAVWELLPYSFLIDYFTNIGDVIMAATVDTSSVKWLTKVTISERYRERNFSGDSAAVAAFNASQNPAVRYDVQTVSPGGYRSVTRTVGRTPTNVPPLALQFDSVDLFSKHMLNIAGLLTSRLF